MNVLRFVFFLGVIYITFDALWNLFLWVLKYFFGIDKREGWVYYISKGLSLYILVTLTAITTTQNLQLADSQLSKFLYPAIGLIVLYFYITSSMQRSKMKAKIKMDTQAIKRMRYDGIFLFSALVLYSLALFFPELHDTQITNWFFDAIASIYQVLLFKVIIGFLALFFLVNILIKSLFATRTLIFSLFGWEGAEDDSFTDRLINEQRQQQSKREEEYTDYEIVEEHTKEDDSQDQDRSLGQEGGER